MLDPLRLFAQKYGLWILGVIHFFGVWVIAFADLDFFAGFTPLNLFLSAALILLAASADDFPKLGYFFLISFSIGYLVEVLGTQTGFPFGEYWYLHNLGFKVFEVPIIIGVNWFVLAYSTALWTKRWFKFPLLQMVFAAALMVALDFFIEPLSATLGFWAWEGNIIPWENYLAWFVVAFIIQFFFVKLNLQHDTKLARWYLPLIASFFIMLNLFL